MNNIENLKNKLKEGYTLVLINDKNIITSQKKGIAPLIDIINQYHKLDNYYAADIIVGKAAALLYVLLNVKYVYANVISIKGIEILEKYNISYSYNIKVDKIINRLGNDICPMEKTVENVSDPVEAYNLLSKKIEELKKGR